MLILSIDRKLRSLHLQSKKADSILRIAKDTERNILHLCLLFVSLHPLYPDLLLSVRGQPVCVCLFVSSIQDYYRQLEINLSVSVSLSPLSRSTVVSWRSTCLCLSLYPPLSRSTVVSWRSTCLSLSLYLCRTTIVSWKSTCLSVSLSPLFRTTIVSWKSTCLSLSLYLLYSGLLSSVGNQPGNHA